MHTIVTVPLILTNCTNRKRGTVSSKLSAHSLPKGTYKEVSSEWVRRIQAAPKNAAAQRLYCGRAVTETLQAARTLNAQVAFVSAGLGIVRAEEAVPAYTLTASGHGADNIGSRLTESYSPARWWDALMRAQRETHALARVIEAQGPSLILVALPASYLQMVGEALTALSPRQRQSLRILGPRRAEEVPAALRSQWLPYDDRLDNPGSGFNGTTADFPHRALRHFVTHLPADRLRRPAAEHHEAVEGWIGALKPYVRPRGATATDEQVLAVIDGLWDRFAGHRTRILRQLRAHSGVACEQGRFRRLANLYEARRA